MIQRDFWSPLKRPPLYSPNLWDTNFFLASVFSGTFCILANDNWKQSSLAKRDSDANAALSDPWHGFRGCLPGIHEALRRQGLLEGRWCLVRAGLSCNVNDSSTVQTILGRAGLNNLEKRMRTLDTDEELSPGQMDQIDRVHAVPWKRV